MLWLSQGSQGESSYSEEKLATNLPLKHFLDGIFLDKVKGLDSSTKHRARVSHSCLVGWARGGANL